MIIFLITALAFGQENDRQIRYQKETEIDFEERDGANFNPLIELRMDWDEDMSRSVNLIK